MNPHITQYRAALQKNLDYGGSLNESSIRDCFISLVNNFAQKRNLQLVPELEYKTGAGAAVRPDGTLKDRFRLTRGYYEAKDTKDDLDKEIAEKRRKGYPFSNIIFEDSQVAVLFQDDIEVMRVDMKNDRELEAILNRYLDFEREEIFNFKKALAKFAGELPGLIEWCREEIDGAKNGNAEFNKKMNMFLAQCKEEVNPDFSYQDMREILVQHILTDKLFSAVLGAVDFLRYNNIAKAINEITETFFSLEKRMQFEAQNRHFYNELSNAAGLIQDYHDKEGFLKTLYEEFYKAYNPKAADRLGVVYTPNEIVKFMIQASDFLLERHFNTGLAEEGVQIIDPACGTGTFITGIIDYITDYKKLQYKYRNEIFANEVGILPYYVANLNIEYTYWQKNSLGMALSGMGYEQFTNISYTDTLDNCFYTENLPDEQPEFHAITDDNSNRIKKQNDTKISVVIGNPPYNANQKNYNDQNANKKYPKIDKRVRETFTAQSKAQKKKYEDMYFRFYRWAMDRLDPERGGLVAFITNRSFIDEINTDGFRAAAENEFDFLYIIDLQGNVRKNQGQAGKGNVFGITIGVAILFAVQLPPRQKPHKKPPIVIRYYEMADEIPAKEKLEWLSQINFGDIPFVRIYPDAKHNWLNISKTNFDTLLPVWETHKIKKITGIGKSKNGNGNETEKTELTAASLFYKCFPGISTNRDEWMYDFSRDTLEKKVKYFISVYNKSLKTGEKDFSIKWSRDLSNVLSRKVKNKFDKNKIIFSMYRPFMKKYYYADNVLSDRFTQTMFDCFSIKDNIYISFTGNGHRHGFFSFASKYIPSLDIFEKCQCLPLYILDEHGKKTCNLRDSSLAEFRSHYGDASISKDDIFHYIYAVFYYPPYRETYKHDLRRSRPRIPFYDDFFRFANAGKRLCELHINFEDAKEHPLKITYSKNSGIKRAFKFDKKNSHIILDEITISNIPLEALNYRIDTRSAIEWLTDQYKIRSQDELTAKLSAYDYANYKTEIISLAGKIITVSLETQKIVQNLAAAKPI
jgi:predicted helicase